MYMATTSCGSEERNGFSGRERTDMACSSCGSEKQTEFSAEMNIHLPGRAGYDKPGVWVFPKILVCLNCGASVFALPEGEQRALKAGVHSN
jgi:hypothetical protein